MKCAIPGANVKVFGRAIHSLHKIGEELYIEALPHGLALRTVNSSRSAFTSFVFSPTFFVSYVQTDDARDQSSAFRCKISLKSCVTVFKSLTTLEKTVDKCKISLQSDEERLIFQLYCHHGIVKTHRLKFMECDSLQAVYSKHLSPNVLVCQTRLLSDAVANFQQGQEEITLIVTPLKLVMKNHIDELDPDANKAVRTELLLNPDEFDCYTIGVDAEITFCLKELRAALFFSEASNLPISLHFESAGKPVVFAINGDVTFEANLVLATLASDLISASQSTASSQQAVASSTRPVINAANQTSARSKHSQSKTLHKASQSADCETFDIHENFTFVDSALNATSALNTTSDVNMTVDDAQCRLDLPADDDLVIPGHSRDMVETEIRDEEQMTTKSRLFDLVVTDSPLMRQSSQTADLDEQPDEVEDNAIPGTPPSKKFKSLFFGLSQSTTSGSQQVVCSRPTVLVEDSDED